MATAKRKGKPIDPISDRARALNDQIASLESEIKKLDTQLQHATAPKLRSTALPHGATIVRKSGPPPEPKPVRGTKPLRSGEGPPRVSRCLKK